MYRLRETDCERDGSEQWDDRLFLMSYSEAHL